MYPINKLWPTVNLVPVPEITQSAQLISFPAFIDMSHLSPVLETTEMQQIDNFNISLLLLIGLAAQVAQRGSPMHLLPLEHVQQLINSSIDPTLINVIAESYWHIANSSTVTVNIDQFRDIVFKVIYAIYSVYNLAFWNIISEIMQQCTVLGHPNVSILIHRVRTSHTVAILDIGVYGNV